MTLLEFHSYLEGARVNCLIITLLLVRGRHEA